MTVPRSKHARSAAHLLTTLTLVLGLSGGTAIVAAAPAHAVVTTATANKALSYVVSKKGAPYQWGAVGPTRFDCSGLTKWAYAKVGKTLPRTAAQQYAATIRVSKYNRMPGDLVFFMSGGSPYHMGIYASKGQLWHAPKAGDHVKLSTIWTASVAYGRVR